MSLRVQPHRGEQMMNKTDFNDLNEQALQKTETNN